MSHHSGLRALVAFGFTVLLIGAGCCPQYKSYNVQVSLDPQFTSGGAAAPFVEVHLFGVNETMYPRYANMSMTKYWDPQSQEGKRDREALVNSKQVKVLQLGGEKTSVTLSAEDPVWRAWQANGAKYLFVLANMPHEHPDEPDKQDPRRAILTLDACKWENKDTMRLRIDPSGIQTLSH